MKKSAKPEWRRTPIQGLYEYRPAGLRETVRGTFYSRFSINGNSTFRSLRTDVFEHAKLKHAKQGANVEKDRRRGADLGTKCKTLGAPYAEVERRMQENSVSKNTRVGTSLRVRTLSSVPERFSFMLWVPLIGPDRLFPRLEKTNSCQPQAAGGVTVRRLSRARHRPEACAAQ